VAGHNKLARIRFGAGLSALGLALTLSACSSVAPGGSVSSPAATVWTKVSDVAAFLGGAVHDLNANTSGFIAAGQVSSNGDTNGAFWASDDGLTWRSVPVSAQNESMLAVGHGPGGLVADSSLCLPATECVGYTFWSSPDGVTWTQHGGDQCCWITSLVTGSFGIVGVGTDWSNFDNQGERDVAAYVSTDGVTWTKAATDPSFMNATVGAVAAGGPGVVALGNGASGLEAWTSTDGMTWRAAQTATPLGRGEVRDMLALNSTLVAVGRDQAGAAAWISTDGNSWSKTDDATSGLQGALMESLAAIPGHLIAVGKDKSGNGAIWSTSDGTTWTAMAGVPSGLPELTAAAASGNTVVVFGANSDGSEVILRGVIGS